MVKVSVRIRTQYKSTLSFKLFVSLKMIHIVQNSVLLMEMCLMIQGNEEP